MMSRSSRHRSPLRQRVTVLFLSLLLAAAIPWADLPYAFASPVPAGPRSIGEPGLGISGVSFTWSTAKPIQYRVDPGPLSSQWNNTTAVVRVTGQFGLWSAVPTT